MLTVYTDQSCVSSDWLDLAAVWHFIVTLPTVSHYNLHLLFVSSVSEKNHVTMTWCGYIFQSGQAFEQWPAVGPFIPWVASQQQSQPFRHHPAYQTASIPLQREHWGHELWTPFLDPLLQERLRIPASILHKQPSREGGRCASPSCTHHLLPFHTSLVALFQQPIFFRSLQSVLLRNGSHWGLQQPNSHIKQMLHFFMWSAYVLKFPFDFPWHPPSGLLPAWPTLLS